MIQVRPKLYRWLMCFSWLSWFTDYSPPTAFPCLVTEVFFPARVFCFLLYADCLCMFCFMNSSVSSSGWASESGSDCASVHKHMCIYNVFSFMEAAIYSIGTVASSLRTTHVASFFSDGNNCWWGLKLITKWWFSGAIAALFTSCHSSLQRNFSPIFRLSIVQF